MSTENNNKNKKTNNKNKKVTSKKPQQKNIKKNESQKIKSVIQVLENKAVKEKKNKKIDVKNLIDKILIGIMIIQVLFLVYYFFGF